MKAEKSRRIFDFSFLEECLDFIYSILHHAADLIRNERSNIDETHSAMQNRKHHSCGENSADFVRENVRPGERTRFSPFPMISVDQAMKIVFDQSKIMNSVDKSLSGEIRFFTFNPIELSEFVNFRIERNSFDRFRIQFLAATKTSGRVYQCRFRGGEFVRLEFTNVHRPNGNRKSVMIERVFFLLCSFRSVRQNCARRILFVLENPEKKRIKAFKVHSSWIHRGFQRAFSIIHH